MRHYTMHLLNAYLLAIVLILAFNPIAARLGLLDRPGPRKVHDHVVPVTGGIAIFGGFLFPVMHLELPIAIRWSLIAGLSGLIALGVADDLLDLRPWTKLAGQLAVALAMVLPGGDLIGPRELLGLGHLRAPLLDVAVTTLFVAGLVNAFNMLDGIDGLAGGAAAAVLGWLAVAAALSGMTGTLMHILLLFAAVLGFLTFNARHPWRRTASVFMGDAGSMMLGAAIAFFLLDLSVGSKSPAPLPALLWLVALPAFDMVILIARRLGSGQSPMRGDRRHVHHFLLRAGLSSQAATSVLVTACALYGGIGVAGWYSAVPDRLMLSALVVPFAAQLYLVVYGWRLIEHMRSAPRGRRPAAAGPFPQAASKSP